MRINENNYVDKAEEAIIELVKDRGIPRICP